LAAALALLVAASSLAAQATTGKIEGTVTDQQGAPIANAQVTVVGTAFGALTSDKGYYFINNVPVGTYTVRARFICYTPAAARRSRRVRGMRAGAERPAERERSHARDERGRGSLGDDRRDRCRVW